MSIWILSPQQRKVLQLIACGFNNAQIGQHTGLKKTTVKNVVTAVFKKLNAVCRIQAIYEGIRLGEISELHAYYYVEARQVTNYLAGSKRQAIQLPHPNHDFLIASSNKTPVPYSSNNPR